MKSRCCKCQQDIFQRRFNLRSKSRLSDFLDGASVCNLVKFPSATIRLISRSAQFRERAQNRGMTPAKARPTPYSRDSSGRHVASRNFAPANFFLFSAVALAQRRDEMHENTFFELESRECRHVSQPLCRIAPNLTKLWRRGSGASYQLLSSSGLNEIPIRMIDKRLIFIFCKECVYFCD